MRKILLFIFPFLIHYSAQSQDNNGIVKGDIYALIIGVSDYADDNISDLNFAHKDAEVFAEYLSSEAGGSVPNDNIKLLTNGKATISNIYAAMAWLENQVKKDDLVYFYFSGHGDLEKGLYQLGFLLAHDTPNLNYKNNAVRVEDVNILANNLSVLKDVAVVMVTDACHSGKLSGSDNVRSTTLGDRLTKVQEGEVRIASCESDQESKESPAWGGGRGAFSYYFIKGLQGLADEMGNGNNEVSLGELDKYLTKKVKKDVNRIMRADQNPVVEGKSRKKMSIVTSLNNVSIADGDASRATVGGGRSASNILSTQDQYFQQMASYQLKENFDFRELSTYNADELMDYMLQVFPVQNLIVDTTSWTNDLSSDVIVRNTFKQQLGAEIHNEVQKAINAYLVGDKDELEKRRFYNADNSDFGEYSYMLDVAMKLTSPNSYLYHMMEVKKHYFAGVDARLSLFSSSNKDSLLTSAFVSQKKALELDDKAAYIHNELGVLHSYNQENELSIAKFERASKIAPDWPVPINNLGRMKYYNGNYEESDSLAYRAVTMKPDYVNAHILRADNGLKLKNYLQSEDNYKKAIEFNEKSYQAYDGLGEVYMKTTAYDVANENFQNAENIRRGIFGNQPLAMYPDDLQDFRPPTKVMESGMVNIPCHVDDDEMPLGDVLANFAIGKRSYDKQQFDEAEKYFKRTILAFSEEPLSHYYLGNIFFNKKDYVASEMFFSLANEYYLSDDNLKIAMDSLYAKREYVKCDFRQEYLDAKFDPINVSYILAETYDSLGHYTRVEDIYNSLINENLDNNYISYLIPYHLLWSMYERRGLYEDAEEIIQQYKSHQRNDGEKELYKFYERMIDRSYDVLDYNYKAGMLAYAMTKRDKDKIMSKTGSTEAVVIVDLDVQEYMLKVPGTGRELFRAFYVPPPHKAAISRLSNVDMDRDSIHVGDIYAKLGELYALDGQWDKAVDNYILAYDFNSDNASPATDLLPLLQDKDQIMVVYELLLKMNDRGQLKYEDFVLLSDYDALAGNYESSDSIYNKLKDLYPIENEYLSEISARRYLLAEQYKVALDKYSNIYADTDMDESDKYTLCRLHAVLGNKEKAETLLEEAVGLGFNYYWVLQNDPLIKSLKDTELHKDLLTELYPFPEELK